jgi:hypothetical protein
MWYFTCSSTLLLLCHQPASNHGAGASQRRSLQHPGIPQQWLKQQTVCLAACSSKHGLASAGMHSVTRVGSVNMSVQGLHYNTHHVSVVLLYLASPACTAADYNHTSPHHQISRRLLVLLLVLSARLALLQGASAQLLLLGCLAPHQTPPFCCVALPPAAAPGAQCCRHPPRRSMLL